METETLDQRSQFITQHLQRVRAKKKGQVPIPDGKLFKFLIGRWRLALILRIPRCCFQWHPWYWQTIAEIALNSSGRYLGNTVNSYPRQLFLWAQQMKNGASAHGPLICASLLQRFKDVAPLTARFKGITDFFSFLSQDSLFQATGTQPNFLYFQSNFSFGFFSWINWQQTNSEKWMHTRCFAYGCMGLFHKTESLSNITKSSNDVIRVLWLIPCLGTALPLVGFISPAHFILLHLVGRFYIVHG